MLTRLQVDGFKNLDGVDVRFGPFTCVAGPNGVGKSNLFDAIAFLSALTDKPLMDAALGLRGGEARRGDVRSLFRRVGDQSADRMRFGVELLIPDPKRVLHDALRTASGAKGRRAKTFSTAAAAHRMAELIDDWTPLRHLDAFDRLEGDTRAALDALGVALRPTRQ